MVSPIVAAIISLFLPGIGQVVQGETQKGIIMFVIALVLAVLTSMVSPMVSFISLIFVYMLHMMLIRWDKLIFIHFIFL